MSYAMTEFLRVTFMTMSIAAGIVLIVQAIIWGEKLGTRLGDWLWNRGD